MYFHLYRADSHTEKQVNKPINNFENKNILSIDNHKNQAEIIKM
jgi:hypothetical protein